jgi:hypothetical protein
MRNAAATGSTHIEAKTKPSVLIAVLYVLTRRDLPESWTIYPPAM